MNVDVNGMISCLAAATGDDASLLRQLQVTLQTTSPATFGFDEHVRYIITAICAQRKMYLLKRLRDEGLPVNQLNIVFESLIVVNSITIIGNLE